MNRNWLERKPEQSLGLQRIQEVRHREEALRLENERREATERLEREKALREAETRLEDRTRVIEKRAAVLTPLLCQIRDYTNQGNHYPVSEECAKNTYQHDIFQLLRKAEVKLTREDEKVALLDLKYAHKGIVWKSVKDSDPDSDYYSSVIIPAACFNGIRVRIDGDTGVTELLSERDVVVPAQKAVPEHWTSGRSGGRVAGIPGRAEYKTKEKYWVSLPDDNEGLRQALADTFHNPICIEVVELSKLDARQENDMSVQAAESADDTLGTIKSILHSLFG